MHYSCFGCGRVSFELTCSRCGLKDENVPLDPSYYPEFQYQSRGLVVDLLFKGKVQQELSADRSAVLRKWKSVV